MRWSRSAAKTLQRYAPMFDGDVRITETDQPSPRRDRLSAGSPLGKVNLSNDRHVALAYSRRVARSSEFSALTPRGEAAVTVVLRKPCHARATRHTATRLAREARVIARPPRLVLGCRDSSVKSKPRSTNVWFAQQGPVRTTDRCIDSDVDAA
jgi:hypothetical protein